MAVQPRQAGRLHEEVVVESGVEDEVDLVAVVPEYRHQVADPEVLDAPVVEEDTHRDDDRTGLLGVSRRWPGRERMAQPHGSMSTPGFMMPRGSSALFAAFSAAAKSGGRWRSYHGR